MADNRSGYRWIVLAVLSISSFFVGISIYAIPPLFSEILQDIRLTKAQMGAIMGAIPVASIFLALIGGTISDKIGSKWSYGVAVILIGLTGMLRGAAGSAAMLISCMAFMGVGVAVMMPNFPKALGSWFEFSELGLVNGTALAAFGLSAAVGMGLAGSVASPALGGWRNTLFLLSFVVILAGIGWLLVFKDRVGPVIRTNGGRELFENIGKVVKVRDIWILAAYSSLLNFSLLAALSLLPVSLFERGKENAGALVSIFMVMSLVFNIIGGYFSDKVGKRKPFLIVGTVTLGLCAILFGFAEGPLLIAALVTGGVGIGSTTPIAMLIPLEIKEIGPQLAATAIGVVMGIGSLGGVLGPLICGWVMDLNQAPWPAFLIIGVVTVSAGLLICLIRETGQPKTAGLKAPGDTFPPRSAAPGNR